MTTTTETTQATGARPKPATRRVTPTGRLIASLDPVYQREEWLAVRRQGIGGSDVPTMLGLDEYQSELDLYLDKIGASGREDEQIEAALWGNLLEDPVAQEWARRQKVRVRRVGTIEHVDRAWQRINLDRRVTGCREHARCALEVKTRSAFKASEWSRGVPDDVEAQCQWGLAVTGMDATHVAALIGGQRLVSYVIKPDLELIDWLTAIGERFWRDHVQALVPPEISSADLLAAWLAKLDVDPATTLDLTGEPADGLRALLARRADLKDRVKELEEIDQELKLLAGERAVVQVDGEKAFTYKTVRARRFSTSEFAAEHPDLYERFRRVSMGRRLDVDRAFR